MRYTNKLFTNSPRVITEIIKYEHKPSKYINYKKRKSRVANETSKPHLMESEKFQSKIVER